MTIRFEGFAPPKHDTRLSKGDAIAHPTFLGIVMGHWDRGLDTNSIARKMFEHESVISFCVRIGREERREQTSWEAL